MSVFGLAWEKGAIPLPLPLAKRMYELGARKLRYMIQWPTIQPARDAWRWDFMDETINNAISAGLKVQINPYFVPAWATDGIEYLSGYDSVCNKAAEALPDSGDSAKCYDRVAIDTGAVDNLGTTLVTRYGDKVFMWGLWNEPGIRDYWLSTREEISEEGGASKSIDRWYTTLALPLMGGLLNVLPRKFINKTLLVPYFYAQLDQYCDYSHLAKIGTAISVIGIHPYADSTEAVMVKALEMSSRLRPYLQGREIEISEIQQCDNVALMKATGMSVTDHNAFRFIDGYDDPGWYHDENGQLKSNPIVKSKSGNWELTEEGKKLKTDLDRYYNPPRRRSVISWFRGLFN